MTYNKIRAWLSQRMGDLTFYADARSPDGEISHDVHDLIGKLRSLANEAELRLINPKFPESSES